MKLTYILDTSAIINNPNIFYLLDDVDFIIPIEVIDELDNLKTKFDGAGFGARRANKILEELRGDGSLLDGIEIENNNFIKVTTCSDLSLVPSTFAQNNDSKIISVAKIYSEKYKGVRLLSADLSLRIKASSIGIDAFSDQEIVLGKDLFYSGFREIDVEPDVINDFYERGSIYVTDDNFYENQGILIKDRYNSSALGIVKGSKIYKLRSDKKDISIQKITARNKEQRFAVEYLMDKSIPMVSIVGQAGAGKTLLAICAAMELLESGAYDKLIICRPAVSTSADIGFLPGDLKEKMQPWMQPIFDNLKFALKCKDTHINYLIENGKIEIESLSFIRGRTFPRTILLVDEAQNTTASEMKAIITRMGNDSKLIVTGDIEQIDSTKVDIYTSGLSIIVNKFKDTNLSAHITLQKTERSELAALAAKIL